MKKRQAPLRELFSEEHICTVKKIDRDFNTLPLWEPNALACELAKEQKRLAEAPELRQMRLLEIEAENLDNAITTMGDVYKKLRHRGVDEFAIAQACKIVFWGVGMNAPVTLSDWVRYWYDDIGANILPCNTIQKFTWIKWGEYQNNPIPKPIIDKWLLTGAFNSGLGLICGKLWRGRYEGKYLIALDFDNETGKDEVCKMLGGDLKRIAEKTIVEQNPKTPQKAHIYFISPIPMQDIKAVASPTKALSLELKGTTGLMYSSPSPRKDNGKYEIIGTLEPRVLTESEAIALRNRIEEIFARYGIDSKQPTIPIAKLAKSKTYAGDNRHEAVLRIAESLIKTLAAKFEEADVRDFVELWNSRHCVPPLEAKDIDKQWSDAKKFILRKIREEAA